VSSPRTDLVRTSLKIDPGTTITGLYWTQVRCTSSISVGETNIRKLENRITALGVISEGYLEKLIKQRGRQIEEYFSMTVNLIRFKLQ
jgi:hypothetical protein